MGEATLPAGTAYHTVENLQELSTKGIDAVIPDNKFRSRDEHFGDRVETRREATGKVVTEDFRYDRRSNEYICPEGKRLRYVTDQKNGKVNRGAAPGVRGCFRAELQRSPANVPHDRI